MNKIILSSLFLMGCLPMFAFAEITIPYSIDEKTLVTFGDSIATSTYNGLENYSYSYLDNYLKISYTYTHGRCCFAAYPPRLYITNEDPSSTSTVAVREVPEVYTLNKNPDHLSDWYLYEIQFYENGYHVSVKRGGDVQIYSEYRNVPGQSIDDWASLVNHYPIDYGEPNSSSMSFRPQPINNYITEATTNSVPVVIVPGIMGSRLVTVSGEEVWPNTLLMVSSFEDLYLNDLTILEDGVTSKVGLYASEVIEGLGGQDFFGGLINLLEEDGYIRNENLFTFPYDWRLDVNVIANELRNKILEIKNITGSEKVDIIAHSMGGLVSRAYMNIDMDFSINKLITLGTPHSGSPKAFKILNYGDNLGVSFLFGLIGLSEERVKFITKNMPSVYQLLPNSLYFQENGSGYYVLNAINGNERLDYLETESFLIQSGLNELLLSSARGLHDSLSNISSATDIKKYNLVGCGVPTIGSFYLLSEGDDSKYNIRFVDGDGTVPTLSAEAFNTSTTYYFDNSKHSTLPSSNKIRSLIKEILSLNGTSTIDILDYQGVGMDSSACSQINGTLISFHSPIDLLVRDGYGNSAGFNDGGSIENNTQSVVYEVINGNSFAFLPEGGDYQITGRSRGNGIFDVRLQKIVSGEVFETFVFPKLKLTDSTLVNVEIIDSNAPVVFLDFDADGLYEEKHDRPNNFDGLVSNLGYTQIEEDDLNEIDNQTSLNRKTGFVSVKDDGDLLGSKVLLDERFVVGINSNVKKNDIFTNASKVSRIIAVPISRKKPEVFYFDIKKTAITIPASLKLLWRNLVYFIELNI